MLINGAAPFINGHPIYQLIIGAAPFINGASLINGAQLCPNYQLALFINGAAPTIS